MTEMCLRCGALPATDNSWPHCEDCYQVTCDEAHQALCDWREQEDAKRSRVPDLLLRVMRGRVPTLRMERGHWRADCPWCDEGGELSQSLYVYQHLYHCFACGATGDAISFLMWDEGLRFIEAVQWLAAEAAQVQP